MAEFSSTLNQEKNINRSDPSRMSNIGQTPLARLRPEKMDDVTIKEQISLIQEICGDIDPDIIALVFHECDYNIQYTIARIKEGNFEDGGWQTAKSNNKKKNHNNLTDQMINGGTQSDSERSLSQRTSPTSSLRGGAGSRYRQEHYPSRPNPNRRGNDFDRNHFIRQPPRKYTNTNKTTPIQQNPNIDTSSSKQKEDITPTPSTSTDEYEFIGGTTQSLTFDNSLKQTPLSSSSTTKHPIPSSIPRQPVSMHRTIQFSTEPIDIQFGDIQWNDSIPIAVTPSNNPSSPIPDQEQENNLSTTNDIDRESTDLLSITNNPIENNLSILPLEGTSHLSDHLTESSSSQQQESSSSIPNPTSTPNTSPTNSFLSNTAPGSNSSAFTPYNTQGNFQTRDYQHYKTAQKPTAYPLPPQQQFFVGTYPYTTPTLYPVITSVDPWSTAGFEPYSTYPPTNYIPTYQTQQQYHTVQPNKYDQYPYDKDFFAHYGQSRLSNTESSQSPKDAPSTSKLSATAASFSQGAFYLNPVLYTVPTYYQDRTIPYPSIDNRDNRNGASNRNYYHQQRSHNNSTWHSQQ